MDDCSSCTGKPIIDKLSINASNDKLNCGATSTQTWRDGQQDTRNCIHNCIINYDTDTSYFAVYDGHREHLVAQYCSDILPDILKYSETYKSGNIEKALEHAFLKLDKSILSETFVNYVETVRCEEYYDKEDEEENLNNLYEEASMPIEQVIEKYEAKKIVSRSRINNDSLPSSSSTSTPQTSGSSCCIKTDSKNARNNKSNNEVYGNSKLHKLNNIKNTDPNIQCEKDCPNSSEDIKEEFKANQKKSVENCEFLKPDEIITSTTVSHENGEVLKKGKGKALMKTKGVIPETPPCSERPKRDTRQDYASILTIDEYSESSEDDLDETFDGPNVDTSDEDDETDELISLDNDSEEDSSIDEEEEEAEQSEEEEEESNEEEEPDEDEVYECLTNMESKPGVDSGSSAVVALLRGNTLYVADVGDSKCVVCRKGQAVEMTFDHKPDHELEHKRINNAGGNVNCGKIDDKLNLSRAFGDHAYKQNKELSELEQVVIALPNIKTTTINPEEDEFMVLACDGIWNNMSNQEVIDFVRDRVKKHRENLSQICEELCDHCSSSSPLKTPGGDNITAVIVEFKTNSFKRRSSEVGDGNPCKKPKTEEKKTST